MRITVHAKPAARDTYVKELGDSSYEVAVKEPPVQGRANAAIVSAIAEHFHIFRGEVKILSGRTSRRKVVEIP